MAWVEVGLVDDALGTGLGPNPAWSDLPGTPGWVPDQTYYKRVLLQLLEDEGGPQVASGIVNWEIYDLAVYWVAPDVEIMAATTPGPEGQVLAFGSVSRVVYGWNGSDWVAYPGKKPVSTLRANGPRVVIELPVYLDWGSAEVAKFLVEAYLPGAFGTPSGSVVLTEVASPDEGLLE